ncbi:MAG: hypothetical protein JAY84_11995 [Candidatus Thiodiazotropha taylori]|nr:hypothetical protein [Candidatus Thiodiazotropha taylori]
MEQATTALITGVYGGIAKQKPGHVTILKHYRLNWGLKRVSGVSLIDLIRLSLGKFFFILGFQENSSLIRTCSRWTGVSRGMFRVLSVNELSTNGKNETETASSYISFAADRFVGADLANPG